MTDSEGIVLTETRLEFEDGVLQRYDDDDNSILRVDASNIRSVNLKRNVSAMGAVTITAAAAIGWISYELVESTAIMVVLYIVAVLVAGLGFLTLVSDKIIVETTTGTVSIETHDPRDVVEGFIVTLRSELRGPV